MWILRWCGLAVVRRCVHGVTGSVARQHSHFHASSRTLKDDYYKTLEVPRGATKKRLRKLQKSRKEVSS